MAKRKALADAFKAKPQTKIAKATIEVADKSEPKRKGYQAPCRKGKKLIGSYLDPDAIKQLKILAVEQDATNEGLIKEALNDLFQKYGKSRIA